MSERYDCLECQMSLYGQKYILKEENMYCISCYEACFSNKCESCQLFIGCTSKVSRVHPAAITIPLSSYLLLIIQDVKVW